MNDVRIRSALRNGALTVLLMSLCAVQVVHAEAWELKDKDGVHHTLSEQKGKWVLVNFWAPWCPMCLQELPEFVAVQQQHKDLQVIGIAIMYKSRKEVLAVASQAALDYPVVLGNEDTAADFGGLIGMPTSFLYDPSGKLVGQHQGPLTQHEIEQAIAQKPEAATLFTR